MAEKPLVEKKFNQDLDVDGKIREGGILSVIYLEVQGNDKEAAKNALESTVFEKMNAEANAKLLQVGLYDIQESAKKEYFTGVAEVKLVADDFRSFVNISMRYGPTALEILEPSEVTISLDDMHAIAGDVSSMMQVFSNQIISMLNNPERAALYKKMIEKRDG